MPHCPNCGEAAGEGDTFCRSCGSPLGPEHGGEQNRSGEHGRQGRADGRSARDRSDETLREGVSGRHHPQRRGETSDSRQPRPEERRQENRRGFLKLGATIAGLAGIAWLFLGDDGGGGPEAPVQQFADGIARDDVEAVHAAFHPNSPSRVRPSRQEIEDFHMEVLETEVLERTENEARVRARMEIRVASTGRQERESAVFQVRRTEGEWKIWDIE